MPDTAASAAAANGAIHLRREYLIIGDPMWLDAWGEIPYFLRKSRQNAGIELKFECRDALPAPLPARIAELGFAVYGGFFTKDERRVGGTAFQPFLTGEAFGFVRFCLAWQIAEGECPTRR